MARILKTSKLESNFFRAKSEVYLEAGDICIKKSLADKVFGKENVVQTFYFLKEKVIVVASASEELFKTICKGNEQILKLKNASGDKAISIQELTQDNKIDESDRDLSFVFQEALNVLKINF